MLLWRLIFMKTKVIICRMASYLHNTKLTDIMRNLFQILFVFCSSCVITAAKNINIQSSKDNLNNRWLILYVNVCQALRIHKKVDFVVFFSTCFN